MAAKKKPAKKPNANKGKPAAAPAVDKQSGDSAKAYRPRKPPIERAARLVGQIVKKCAALVKNTARWRGDASPEQKDARERIVSNLQELAGDASPLSQLNSDLAFLIDTGWKPQFGAPGRKPLQPGQAVRLKDVRFEPEIHGDANDFVVVRSTDKFVLIRPADDSEATPLPVLRPWIEVVGATNDNDDDDDNDDVEIEDDSEDDDEEATDRH